VELLITQFSLLVVVLWCVVLPVGSYCLILVCCSNLYQYCIVCLLI
jgi:hypothetical protein